MTKDPIIRRIYCAAPLIRSQQQQQKKIIFTNSQVPVNLRRLAHPKEKSCLLPVHPHLVSQPKKKKILLSRLSVCLCLCIFFEKNKQTNKQRGSALLFLSGSPSRGANFPPIRLLL